jgi:hypothetical protein
MEPVMADADFPGQTIAVHRDAWPDLLPEFAEMVAPPISVSSVPVTFRAGPDAERRRQQARSQANMPVGRHLRPTR